MAHNITLDFTQSQVEFVELNQIIAKVANFPILPAFITQHHRCTVINIVSVVVAIAIVVALAMITQTLNSFDKPTNEFGTFSFREVKRPNQ